MYCVNAFVWSICWTINHAHKAVGGIDMSQIHSEALLYVLAPNKQQQQYRSCRIGTHAPRYTLVILNPHVYHGARKLKRQSE